MTENEQGFDAEEQAAMDAMREDTAPVEEQTPEKEEPTAEPEPEPEEAKKPEEEGNPEFKTTRDKPPEGFVPHQAMHAEREKRKAAEEALAKYEARIEALEKQFGPAPEAPPEYKDPLEDPEGHRKWAEWRADKARDDAIAEFTKNSQADAQRQQRLSRAAQAEQEFTSQKADYPKATEHLKQARLNELMSQGFGQDEAIKQMSQEANAIFDMAEKVGFNPAELVYLQAQKYGYKAGSEQEQHEPPPEQKIEHLANAQQQARGVGGAGGSAQKGGLTLAQMAEMDPSDFAKLDPVEKRKAMGG